jgi:pyridoxal/pyridoxine/pyridoxamine kinase
LSTSSIIPPVKAIPRLAAATATANEAGNTPTNTTVTVISNVGNSYVAQGGPSNVSTNIIQKQTSIFGGVGDLSSGGIIAGL